MINFTILSLSVSSCFSFSPMFVGNSHLISNSRFKHFTNTIFYDVNNIVLDSSVFDHGSGSILIVDKQKRKFIRDINEQYSDLDFVQNNFTTIKDPIGGVVIIRDCNFLSLTLSEQYLIFLEDVNVSVYFTNILFSDITAKKNLIRLYAKATTITHVCCSGLKKIDNYEGDGLFLYSNTNKGSFLKIIYSTLIGTSEIFTNVFRMFYMPSQCAIKMQCLNCSNFNMYGNNPEHRFFFLESPECFNFVMNTVYNVEAPRIIEMTNKFHNNYIGMSNFINNKFTFDNGGCIYYVPFKEYTLVVDNCFFSCKSGSSGNFFVLQGDTNTDKMYVRNCVFEENKGGLNLGWVIYEGINTISSSMNNVLAHYGVPGHCYAEPDRNAYGCKNYSCVIGTGCDEEAFNFKPGDETYTEKFHGDVDTPTPIPTDYFTQSYKFTYSSLFSLSNDFSDSKKFSSSFYFTKTAGFSATFYFSRSKFFTKSTCFTKSSDFMKTSEFTKTDGFTDSKDFTGTKYFTKTDGFTKTGYFTETTNFTDSGAFTESTFFTESFDFTQSNDFNKTVEFTKSNDFTRTDYFSETINFSCSELFSKSLFFTPSKNFTQTDDFDKTIGFTKSNFFTDSNYFSETTNFTKSSCFTESDDFSKSSSFSLSQKFNLTDSFSKSFYFTFSQCFNQTDSFSKSLVFTKSMNFDPTEDFDRTHKFTKSNVFSESNRFSKSNNFIQTSDFTLTCKFTSSNLFSSSDIFTCSSNFSKSNEFTKSFYFSASKYFKAALPSSHFSLSFAFSSSNTLIKNTFINIDIKQDESSHISNGIKIGIGIAAGLVGAGIIVCAVIFFRKRKITSLSDFDEELITVNEDTNTFTQMSNPLIGLLSDDDPFQDEFD